MTAKSCTLGLVRSNDFLLAAAIVLAGFLASGPARAYCRTSTASTPTFDGHVCTPPHADDSGLPIYWGMPRVTYSLQEDASMDIPFETFQALVRAAFDTWTSVDCDGAPPRIELVEAEAAICATQEYNKDRGNANILMFRDQIWDHEPEELAVTTVTFDLDTGEIYDADMELNSALWNFTTGEVAVDIDLLSVLTHEAGHFLGLSHSRAPGATMDDSYTPPSIDDLRTLSDDDEAGICAIYPPGPVAEGCDATPRHGFSVLCAADQPGPVADEPPDERCCCVEGDECVDGVCVPAGCACTTVPVPGGGSWPATLPLAALVTALVRRRPRRK